MEEYLIWRGLFWNPFNEIECDEFIVSAFILKLLDDIILDVSLSLSQEYIYSFLCESILEIELLLCQFECRVKLI